MWQMAVSAKEKKERRVKGLTEQLVIEVFSNKRIFEQKPAGSNVMWGKNIPDSIASVKSLPSP